MRAFVFLAAASVTAAAFSQEPAATAAASTVTVDQLTQYLGALTPRELGPTTMGGRIMSLAVYEAEPRVFYVGFASGGVFKSENGGITMTPLFQKEDSISIGALAVNQSDPNDVWAGSGEASSRNSTSWGYGVYRSKDGGQTWTNMGLRASGHIGMIAIDPKNPEHVLVAALGPLWGEGGERGLYRTTDGGKTWTKVIDVGTKAGGCDVYFDPKNPKNALASTWERVRLPHNFYSRGPGSAIWRSTDNGKTWKRITKGMPEGELGRIGLSPFRKDPKVWVATIDAKEGGVFRSEDGGESWTKVNSLNPRPFYFSTPKQDPNDVNRIYILGVGIHRSEDKGKTFREMDTPLHSDHHAAWIDPTDSNHILMANDGGLGQSRDLGKTWEAIDNMAVGQFYAVAVDMRKPYWVYGGLQDNGSWAGPTQTKRGGVSFYDWQFVQGGDGFHMQVDREDWRWAYAESQGGAITRIDQVTGESRGIRPNPARLGEPEGTRYRFNWSSPMLISPHNSATIYFGGNKLFKSVNRGDAWKVVSPDLTTNDAEKQMPVVGDAVRSGAETHCTIITIGESPVKQGVLWVGTDDGQVQVSKDDGVNWTNVTANIPGAGPDLWVSRVRPSRFKEGRCYVTLDGHRTNDMKPYVFVSDDFGSTWTSLAGTLPESGSCYVVTEGERNEDLLYLGTEHGLFFSMDRGQNWVRFTTGSWPNVRTDDLVVHPRELDLVVATHGRSFWLVNVSALEQLTATERAKDAVILTPQAIYLMGRQPGGWFAGQDEFGSPNTQPGTTVFYHLKAATTDKVKVVVQDVNGREIASLDGKGDAGLNSVRFRPQRGRLPARTTDYAAVLMVGDKEVGRAVLRVENLPDSNDRNAFIP